MIVSALLLLKSSREHLEAGFLLLRLRLKYIDLSETYIPNSESTFAHDLTVETDDMPQSVI